MGGETERYVTYHHYLCGIPSIPIQQPKPPINYCVRGGVKDVEANLKHAAIIRQEVNNINET